MPCPTKDGFVELTSALEVPIHLSVSVTCLFQRLLVKSRLDADSKYERKIVALKISCLYSCVGESGKKEVPEVERQLGDNCKKAEDVDKKQSVWSAAKSAHFERLSQMSNNAAAVDLINQRKHDNWSAPELLWFVRSSHNSPIMVSMCQSSLIYDVLRSSYCMNSLKAQAGLVSNVVIRVVAWQSCSLFIRLCWIAPSLALFRCASIS